MTPSLSRRRRLLVPEVVQTSAMDCGPAVLKCLLEGYGIPVSYGRLREACQTDVDGTSIDVLEAVANQLGLAAEQIMLPTDHLLLPEADALPAVLVVRLPNNFTHFLLVWRRHGSFVQVMDPASGRRWSAGRRLLEEVYVHTARVPAADWRAWAGSDDFLLPLAARLRALGCGRDGRTLIDKAAATVAWRPLAWLDAATRFSETLAGAGALRRGREAHRFLRALLERGGETPPGQGSILPEPYWSVRPAPPADGTEQMFLRGAVLLRVRGRSPPATAMGGTAPAGTPAALNRELAVALAEPASRPARALCGLLRGAGGLQFVGLAIALPLVAATAVLEAVLLRGLLDARRDLGLTEQRLGAVALLLAFTTAVLLLELAVAHVLFGLGRRLEAKLRLAFLGKVPRLHDRYFQSRPTSDMAERGHAAHQVRALPRLAGQFVRAGLTLLLTAAAIAWVDPAAAPLAFAAAALAAGLPIAFNPLLQGLDLRARTQAGALNRFYLDALLGLAAVRAHGGEQAVRREHEGLLVDWAQATRRLLRWLVVVEGLQITSGIALAGWLLLLHAGRAEDAAAALLLAYWALNLPVLGEELGLVGRQYPGLRNITLRLLEPLGAPEEAPPAEPQAAPPGEPAVSITLEGVTVRAAGHTILQDLNLHIPAGSHVAVVGASGAGKSSLVGLLLGWHRAAAGRVLVDGQPLDSARLDCLRTETAWVDPAVRLWNRSLVLNLLYGSPAGGTAPVGQVLHAAELHGVLRQLPEGLQTLLGEGGGLLSGGEGQRVRLGRAFHRPGVRLAILDEPFRGLDRHQRHLLLERARRLWQGATLICITHDVGETRAFERVLVVEAGRVAEDGSPAKLAADPGSRYRALLEAEGAVRRGLWARCLWRRLRLEGGRLIPGAAEEA
jgi:ATP-binding cassette subfamily B protein